MNRKSALSTIGYAIVLVIILGVVMIISAPMMADKYKDKPVKNDINKNVDTNQINIDELNQIQETENRINSRLSSIEQRQNEIENSNNISDKYICSIEGTVDEQGSIIEINSQSDVKNQKIVFVCEYRR